MHLHPGNFVAKLAALIVFVLLAPAALADEEHEIDCVNAATVAEYAASERDKGAVLERVLAEINELTEPGSDDRRNFRSIAGLAFSVYQDLSPPRLAALIYHRCMTLVDV
jgi:AcrR family transcriptional regulator